MNIVYYSYNFFPMADAESYCSTRFASALSRVGHNVTVVTMDWPMNVSQDQYDALVCPNLKIIRLPFSKKRNSPLKALLWYGHNSQMAVDVQASAKVVKDILKKLDNPILITRTMPVTSAMVGLKARKHAHRWMAHFSDPLPWEGYANTFGHKLLSRLEYNIVRKALMKADVVSLTCSHVNRYFKELYGACFDEKKVCKLTHIGDYRLGDAVSQSADGGPILLHTGLVFASRGGRVIPQIMNEFHKEGYKYKFIQVGRVTGDIKDSWSNSSNMEIHNTASLSESLTFCQKARAIFVPDVESSLGYSPVLPSKFVYRIMDNQPIVAYSYKESEMHDYATKYPEAGIFWAEIGNIESLKRAIKDAMEYDNTKIDRTRIRECFAEDTIVKAFEYALNRTFKLSTF